MIDIRLITPDLVSFVEAAPFRFMVITGPKAENPKVCYSRVFEVGPWSSCPCRWKSLDVGYFCRHQAHDDAVKAVRTSPEKFTGRECRDA